METALDLKGLDIAEIKGIIFVFAISLLDTIIQDGGMKERSNDCYLIYIISL